jgi:hypothetical protein
MWSWQLGSVDLESLLAWDVAKWTWETCKLNLGKYQSKCYSIHTYSSHAIPCNGRPWALKFELEKYDFDIHKRDFHGQKWPKFIRFLKSKNSKFLDFYDKFQ